jgi:hypothetical protein
MLALRYVALLALTLWVGGLLVLGGIAAPSIFDVLAAQGVPESRALAGAIFGEALRRFHLLSYACGALLLVALFARAVMGPRPRWFGVRLAFVLTMLAASVYSGMIVSGRIERLRADIGVSPSTLPESDPRRATFGRLHATSTAVQLIPFLGGLILLFFEMKES